MTASRYNSREHEYWTNFLYELIDVQSLERCDPQGVFYATPFSGSTTRCPTGIPTKEETTRAGGPSMQNGIRFSAAPNIDV